jgi:glyoxylase-like metal-dependent hydrolase (beta-lactamase superfamily II)
VGQQYQHFTLQHITDGVYAALGIPGQAAVSNAGIIDLGDSTLIFDAFAYPAAAKELLRASWQLTGRDPSLVINSHGHSDHWGGNQVCVPGATILSTEATRAQMQEQIDSWMSEIIDDPRIMAEYIKELEERIAITDEGPLKVSLRNTLSSQKHFLNDLSTFEPTLPTETITDGMEFSGQSHRVIVRVFENCHTCSDAFLVLPEVGVAFLGDLAFFRSHPFMPDSDPEVWSTKLMELVSLDLGTCIPGHGPVGGVDDLHLVRKYITALPSQVARAYDKGIDEADVAMLPVPAPFDEWIDGYGRFERNVRFLFNRLRSSKGQDC